MILYVIGVISMILGYVFAWTAWPLWIIHAIYEMVKTEQGFFTIVFSNLGLGLVQFILGLALIFVPAIISTIFNK